MGEDQRILVPVRVQARSSNNAVIGVVNGKLKIRTTNAPVDGRANHAVQRLLAGEFGVAPSRVTLMRGASSRDKLFSVTAPSRLPEYIAQLTKPERL